MWCGDIDADGKYDVISYANNSINTFRSNGDGTYQYFSQSVLSSQFDNLKVWTGDFNGDGRTDLMSLENSKMYTYFSNGDGTYQVVASPTFNSSQISATFMVVGDFNGDGKADFVCNTNGKLWTYFANGDGTFQQKSFDRTPYPNPGTMYVGDFNGDGKADVVSFAPTDIRIFFSKGDGSYSFVSYTSPFDVYFIDDIAKFGDFNGDGKTDIIAYNACESPCEVFLTTYFSKGNGDFSAIMHASSGSLIYGIQNWFLDLDGDGKTDYVFPILSGYPLQANFRPGAYPDLLTNIINPFGGQNSITYRPLTDSTIYQRDTDAVYPVQDVQTPFYVVSDLVVTDGRGGNYDYVYSYRGSKLHHLGRGGLGFRATTEVDVSADARTSTFYRQTFPHIGLPDSIEYDRNSDGSPFKETIHDYWNIPSYPGTAPTVSFTAPKQVDILEWDGSTTQNRTIRREFSYDSALYGNLTSTYHHGDLANANDQREETADWIVDATNWLHRKKTLKLKDGAGNVVRQKWLYYDNQGHGVLGSAGLVTKEENDAGGGMGAPDNPLFLYTYDPAIGVRTNIKDPRQCDITTTYESSKTFPQTVSFCGFTKTYQFDLGHGVVRSVTDPNALGDTPLPTTTYDYDGFGRLTKITGPLDGASTYGSESRQYLEWGTVGAQRVLYLQTEDNGTDHVLWHAEYFDGLGRIFLNQREGPDTSVTGQTIATTESFDSRNLVIGRSAPYFINSSGSPVETPKFDTFAYDPLGRAIQVTHADSTYRTSLYQRGVVTLTDERNKPTKRYFDGLEQLIKVQESNGGSTYDTTYERDASGALKTVTNALGHVTRIEYDVLGRKRAMCDPNMGTAANVASCTTSTTGAWVYTYNPAGDLLTQKDAKNQTLTFTYDIHGRPVTKKQGTTTITSWTYDDPAVMFSTGRVTRIVDQPASQNTITSFFYDVLGRVTINDRTVMGSTYRIIQSYDALDRIKTATFPAPDNETVTYSYNEAGWFKSASGYIMGIVYDARGQKTSLTYANGRVTSWTYHPDRFWTTNQTTSGNQQNLSYGRDNVGNITSITDNLGGTASRTFTYDDLNRLITASGPFGPNQAQQNCSYGYNAIGNITDKCGATLSYSDAMHPSAVTNNSATGKDYTYDQNGNMLTRGNQTLAWDIDNRVTQISISGVGTYMEYDYSGMRVKKNAPTGITLFPFKGMEIDPSGTMTKFISIGTETFASKKTTSTGTPSYYFYHNDHLGGVNVITDYLGNRAQLNEYDPWGVVSKSEGATSGTSATVDLNHRFTGQELDPETGVYYYGGRYYDSDISRFVSLDAYVQYPAMPQDLNRYSYVLNNPVNLKDPSGQFFELLFLAAIATIAGEVAPTVTVTTIMQVITGVTVLAAFHGSLAWAMNKAGQSELDKYGKDKTAENNVEKNSQKKDVGKNGRENVSGAPGDDNPEPWWSGKLPCLHCWMPDWMKEPKRLIPKYCSAGGFAYGGGAFKAGSLHVEILGVIEYDSKLGGSHGGIFAAGAGNRVYGVDASRTWSDWQEHDGLIALGGGEFSAASSKFGKKLNVDTLDYGGLAVFDGDLNVGGYAGLSLGSGRTFGGGGYVTLSWGGCK